MNRLKTLSAVLTLLYTVNPSWRVYASEPQKKRLKLQDTHLTKIVHFCIWLGDPKNRDINFITGNSTEINHLKDSNKNIEIEHITLCDKPEATEKALGAGQGFIFQKVDLQFIEGIDNDTTTGG